MALEEISVSSKEIDAQKDIPMKVWAGFVAGDEDRMEILEIKTKQKNKAKTDEYGEEARLTVLDKSKIARGVVMPGRSFNGNPSWMLCPAMDESFEPLDFGLYLSSHVQLNNALEEIGAGGIVEFEVTEISNNKSKNGDSYTKFHYRISADKTNGEITRYVPTSKQKLPF